MTKTIAVRVPIKGYEGIYSVDKFGNVYNDKRGKMLKQHICRGGYCQVFLYKKNQVKGKYVHRLVADAFVNNPNYLPQVDHLNGCKTDNRSENLEWVTASENVIRAFHKGLKKASEKQKKAVACSNRKRKSIPVIASKDEIAVCFRSSRAFSEAVGISTGMAAMLIKGKRSNAKGWKLRKVGEF